MGIGIGHMGHSSSIYDKKPQTVIERIVEKPVYISRMPNPDPMNWILNKSKKMGNYLIVDVTYPDCTNYEGRKFMLYEGVTIRELRNQRSLDPHFSSNKKFHSPIARFEPTESGWNMAELLACKLVSLDVEKEQEEVG
jgi:hypothetical protein